MPVFDPAPPHFGVWHVRLTTQDSSRLWRRVTLEMAPQYPEVAVDFMYVDNAWCAAHATPCHAHSHHAGATTPARCANFLVLECPPEH